jgi:hypothetical protein
MKCMVNHRLPAHRSSDVKSNRNKLLQRQPSRVRSTNLAFDVSFIISGWEETSFHVLCECETLASLRHTYLGSFVLDPEDIKQLSIGAIWNFAKGTGLLQLSIEHGAQSVFDMFHTVVLVHKYYLIVRLAQQPYER